MTENLVAALESEATFREIVEFVQERDYHKKIVDLMMAEPDNELAAAGFMLSLMRASMMIMGVLEENEDKVNSFGIWMSWALRVAQEGGLPPNEVAFVLKKLADTEPEVVESANGEVN